MKLTPRESTLVKRMDIQPAKNLLPIMKSCAHCKYWQENSQQGWCHRVGGHAFDKLADTPEESPFAWVCRGFRRGDLG